MKKKEKKLYKKDPSRTKTLGEIATQLHTTAPIDTTVEELGSTMTADFVDRLKSEIERGKKIYHGDFFIIMLTKKEKIIANAVAAYFSCSAGCPTPNYDQTVYHYSRADDELYLTWTIPSREWSFFLIENALLLDPVFKELLGYVLDFSDGKLFQKSCILNEQKATQLAKVA